MENLSLPFLSVVVCTYNHEKYIAKCLDSIITQKTTFTFEVILGEDESSDDTRKICIAYAKSNSNIITLFLRFRKDAIYIKNNPTGLFNFSENLKSAQGKYIALCDGDDYWTDPLKLQKQVDFLEAHPDCVGCFHNSQMVDENGNLIREEYYQKTNKAYFNQEDALKTLKSSYSTASLVFRREAIMKELEDFKKIGSDFILDILLTKHGLLHYIDENMSAYRIHSGGIWQGTNRANHAKMYLSRFKFLYHLQGFYHKKYVIKKLLEYYTEISRFEKDEKERKKYGRDKYLFFLKPNVTSLKVLFELTIASLKYRVTILTTR